MTTAKATSITGSCGVHNAAARKGSLHLLEALDKSKSSDVYGGVRVFALLFVVFRCFSYSPLRGHKTTVARGKLWRH